MRLRLITLALSTLTMTACAGGSTTASDKSTPSQTPTATLSPTEDYIAKAEALCADATGRMASLASPTTPAEYVASREQSAEITRGVVTGLDRLTPPAADRARVEKSFLVPLRSIAQSMEASLPKIRAAAPKGLAAMQALPVPPVVKADITDMKAYGFYNCFQLVYVG